MMERIKYLQILNNIKEEAKTAPTGILSQGKSMDNYMDTQSLTYQMWHLQLNKLKLWKKALLFALHLVPQINHKYWLASKNSTEDFVSSTTFTKKMDTLTTSPLRRQNWLVSWHLIWMTVRIHTRIYTHNSEIRGTGNPLTPINRWMCLESFQIRTP